MVKAFTKTIFRTFFSNKGRFLANFLVIFLSLAITAGLGALPPAFEASFLKNYEKGNVPDVIAKYNSEAFLNPPSFDNLDKIKKIEGFTSIDYQNENSEYSRNYWLDLKNSELMAPSLIEGELPKEKDEILAMKGSLNRRDYKVGDVVSMAPYSFLSAYSPLPIWSEKSDYKIVGIVESPLYISVAKERAYIEGDEEKYVSSIFYFDTNTLPSTLSQLLPKTDQAIQLDIPHAYMKDSYKNEIEEWKNTLDSSIRDKVSFLTLEENTSYALFKNYNEKVSKIAAVFPLFFITVCALVNLLTVTRLVKDERSAIGCYRSLGESKGKIIVKYSLFSLLSTGLGALSGYLVGTPLLPIVVLPAYGAVFEMKPYPIDMYNLVGIVVAILTTLISLFIAVISSLSYLKETPASLLKEKAPKAGKKIFLERVPFLWRKIPFSFKNSFRNIFRQKRNSSLTALSVLGSTILILIGFSLLDVSRALENDDLYANVASSMGAISFVIIAFAISMAITVIYSLANMNIQDRQRELATLKVLGYHNKECSAYTFREILMISLFASLLGLPLGAALIAWVFSYLGFGSITDVQWYSYLLSFFVITLTTILVNQLLIPKIKAIDMNASLKSLE